MQRYFVLTAVLLLSAVIRPVAYAVEPTPLSLNARLERAMLDPQRSEANRGRNVWRHPLATLEFFGLRDGMRVMEIWPGAGWYSEVLAPAWRDHGDFLLASYDVSIPGQPEYRYALHQQLIEKLAADPQRYDQVEVVPYSPPESNHLGPAASLDAIVSFRNLHGWYNDGHAELVLAEFFRVLKSGGILGLVQHRAEPGADPAQSARQGYLPEATVIALAEQAGFRLEARSEINANPKDTHQHPAGVWTLPPSYRLGEQDREKYAAIGESDRMTLRFRKP